MVPPTALQVQGLGFLDKAFPLSGPETRAAQAGLF